MVQPGVSPAGGQWIAEHGVRQFIDIGSGLPTVGNTHDVVQRVAPDARVVYIDNDPMVETQSRTLLAVLDDCGDPRGPARSGHDPRQPASSASSSTSACWSGC